MFARGFPPPVWASVCIIVFLFGHCAAEYLFPGGYHAIQRIAQQQWYLRVERILFVPLAAGLLLLLLLPFADRYQWLPRPVLLWGALIGIALVGLWFLIFALTRDFLVFRYWPRERIT